ncbi:MAG: oxidoreductase, partial [Myxococcota bacterium]
GWPVANGDRQLDPDLGAGHEARVRASTPPVHGLGAHTAPPGIVFRARPQHSVAYRDAALVALHGSWNRTRKDGYEVVSLHWKADGTIREEPFLTGFLVDEEVIGRPVDVAEMRDGTIFVSDDYAGAVYRVTPTGVAGAPAARAGAPAAASVPELRPRDPLAGLAAAERAERTARGATQWNALDCAGCHVPEQADPGVVPVELEALATRYGLAELTVFLAAPTPPMPVVALGDRDREDLAVFLLERF